MIKTSLGNVSRFPKPQTRKDKMPACHLSHTSTQSMSIVGSAPQVELLMKSNYSGYDHVTRLLECLYKDIVQNTDIPSGYTGLGYDRDTYTINQIKSCSPHELRYLLVSLGQYLEEDKIKGNINAQACCKLFLSIYEQELGL